MIISNAVMKFLGSQLFGNLLLLLTVIVALVVGYRQILLNDVVEIYAVPTTKQVIDNKDSSKTYSVPIIFIQNVGTRLVYIDKYIFSGTTYNTNGQVLPSTYSKADAGYWIDLPMNGQNHVSIVVYYHDLDERNWSSEIIADLLNGFWKANSLPRIKQ